MRIIKPSFEIWEQEKGLEGIHKQIERAGRICYASDPIEGKAKDFVDRMIRNGHTAMLEHGTIYLQVNNTMGNAWLFAERYKRNKYSSSVEFINKSDLSNRGIPFTIYYITTNYRVLVENEWLDDLKYLCEPTLYHEKRITVHFTTQIAISREFNRHRVNSMAEQSTRNCNYSKGKFGEVGINLPTFLSSTDGVEKWLTEVNLDAYLKELDDIYKGHGKGGLTSEAWTSFDWWFYSNYISEKAYLAMLKKGCTPQEARTVLPLDTNTELVHTASIEEWKHFFTLRDDKQHAHPDAYVLAHPLHKEFKDKEFISVDTE